MPTLKDAKKVIGLGFAEAIEALVGPLDATQTEVFMRSYRRHYFSSEEIVTLFDGIDSLLHGLRTQSSLTAVATGKSRAGLNRVLQNASLSHRFDATRTADETASKPHPKMLFELLDALGVHADEAVMIGDTTYDVDMAHEAGMTSIGVSYGAHDEHRLASSRPAVLVHSVVQLQQLLIRD
jgi:phosphoglycolate phosphatase